MCQLFTSHLVAQKSTNCGTKRHQFFAQHKVRIRIVAHYYLELTQDHLLVSLFREAADEISGMDGACGFDERAGGK